MKALKITLSAVACVVLALGFILLCAIGYFRLPVSAYYKNSENAFVMPGLNDGYVPQGFCYDQEETWFLATGYMTDHSCSPVYVVDKESGEELKMAYLKLEDGSDYTGHGGGISFWNDYLYVADGGENCVYVYRYSDLKNVSNGGSINSIGSFSTEVGDDHIQPAFVEVHGDKIVIGEFYRDGNYPTPDSHKITTPNGDENTALAVEFSLDENFEYGINPVPEKAYSMREQVQGVTFNDGKMYLSTSWGVAFSHIFVYDLEKTTSDNLNVLGADIPVYHLDGASLIVDMKIPPMSEEIAIVDGKLYVSCESASNKYIFGKFTGGKWCYATDLSDYGI